MKATSSKTPKAGKPNKTVAELKKEAKATTGGKPPASSKKPKGAARTKLAEAANPGGVNNPREKNRTKKAPSSTPSPSPEEVDNLIIESQMNDPRTPAAVAAGNTEGLHPKVVEAFTPQTAPETPPAAPPPAKRVIKRLIIPKPAPPPQEAPQEAVPITAQLDPDTQRKLDNTMFKQVRLETMMTQLLTRNSALENTVGILARTLDQQLSRLQTNRTTSDEDAVFPRRAFKKISFKLRKRSIDVQIDMVNGETLRLRCPDYSALMHLLSTQTLREGIEILGDKVEPAPGTVAPRALRGPRQEEHKPVLGGPKKFTGSDNSAESAQKAHNRSREKAEKAIRATPKGNDQALINALVSSGFTEDVAYEAADNCERLTDLFKQQWEAKKAHLASERSKEFQQEGGNQ